MGLLNYELALRFVFEEPPHFHYHSTIYTLSSSGWVLFSPHLTVLVIVGVFLRATTLVKVRSCVLLSLICITLVIFYNESLSLYSWSFDRLSRNTW